MQCWRIAVRQAMHSGSLENLVCEVTLGGRKCRLRGVLGMERNNRDFNRKVGK